MKPFDKLARRVEREWRGVESFTGLATKALQELDYGLSQEQLDAGLARWLRTAQIPDQVNLHNTFGQPSVTLFNNGKFVVDLYFWLTFDTSIHSHGFRGAFRVLHGSSIHETFDVKVKKSIAPDVALVDLGISKAETLQAGDIRPIDPGPAHRVIHLENPTVTLCVKTINEPRIAQWKYFPTGLAIRMRRLDPALIKKVYYFQYLLGRDAKGAAAFLGYVLRKLDRSTCMNLYGAIANGAYDLSEQAALAFATTLRELHGKADWFKRYEAIDHVLAQDLHFEDCTPTQRFVAHAINVGYHALEPHFDDVVLSLLNVESIFGHEISINDREAIKGLLRNPSRNIPKHLEPFGQIRKMRDFLAKLT